MINMFKKTFFGYKQNSVNETIKMYNNKIEIEVEKQEKAIETALKEQEQLAEQLNTLSSKVENARFNTLMIEKFQKYMPNVIDEARAYTEETCNELMYETESFSEEIDEQIFSLNEKIDMIKERIQSLVQGVSDVTKLVDRNQLDEDEQNSKLNDMMNNFKTRVETPKELGIPMEKLSLKEKSGNLMQELCQLEKEEINLFLHEKDEINKGSISLDQVAITNDY